MADEKNEAKEADEELKKILGLVLETRQLLVSMHLQKEIIWIL